MLRRLLFNIIMLAFLFCGASVGMEALGLLFPDGGSTAPKRSIEALIAQIEADEDNRNVPREPEAEHLWPAIDPREAAGARDKAGDGDEERKAAEGAPSTVSLSGSDEPVATTTAAWEPLIVVEARLEAETKPHPMAMQEPDAPRDAPVVVDSRVVTLPEAAAPRADDCGARCQARQAGPRVSRQTAGTQKRRRAPRAVSRSDCLLFCWL